MNNKRGRPSVQDKILNKNNHDTCVNVSISLPSKLLTNVLDNIVGSNRSEKLVKCIKIGYEKTVNSERLP